MSSHCGSSNDGDVRLTHTCAGDSPLIAGVPECQACAQVIPCDSELAAIKRRSIAWADEYRGSDAYQAIADVNTLLRMVDDLARSVGRHEMARRTLEDRCERFEGERDGLRAKLAEAEDSRMADVVNHNNVVRELEAKLAEADAGYKRMEQAAEHWHAKFEAAEARVRDLLAHQEKLTNALFSACGNHVDLDKLDEGDGL